MNETPLHSVQEDSSVPKDNSFHKSEAPRPEISNRYSSRFSNVDRRSMSNTVFVVDDAIFTSAMPRPSHWSIAWSDLMMTMFILFLSMFVYQTANQEFLQEKEPEVIGGDTTEALQTLDSSGATFPFNPIYPGAPLMTSGTVKKVEVIEVEDLDPDSAFQTELPVLPPTPTPTATAPQQQPPSEPEKQEQLDDELDQQLKPEKIAKKIAIVVEKEVEPIKVAPTTLSKEQDILEPRPLTLEEEPTVTADKFQEIYTMSQGALKDNKLDKFATIDLIPDKTMRIILTGDLLFELGESELSQKAMESLQKLTSVIKTTPYMVNVVGHTDNVPMHSAKYKSNWELSVSRASTVARFLIDVMDMPPNQFVVSGYASYRPVKPNTTTQNRAKNRRVEIIISKRLPQPLPATDNNLQ